MQENVLFPHWAGFHGGGGLKPSQNGNIWSTFVLPRLLYGLEALLLKRKILMDLKGSRGDV